MEQIFETNDELDQCTKDTPYFNFDNQIHLAKVVKCYDGDTIHCVFKASKDAQYSKFKIRMAGYDSPEMKPSKKIPEELRQQEKLKAIDARNRLQDIILGKNIYIYCEKFDKYGRLLATIKINKNDEKTVNDMMVDEGHGYKYDGGTKKKFTL